MEIRPIHTESDYEAALRRIEALWGAPAGTADGNEVDILMILTEAYERQHYPIDRPDPKDTASRKLAALGGTMPKLKDVPRRRAPRIGID